MRILIDIGHPAHVHLFRNTVNQLACNGHNVFITARNKQMIRELLDQYQLHYTIRHNSRKGVAAKLIGFIIITLQLLKQYKRNKSDLLVGGVGNAYISLLSFLTRTPSIIFDDTEHAQSELFFIIKFADCIVTPDCYLKSLGSKHIRYKGYHELAYLHPNRFTPDPSILDLLGVQKDEKYIILRFVSWNASHDVGHSGLSIEIKMKAVKELSKYAKVFISSEGELPDDLKTYQIKIPPEKMHDALAFATLFVGEGATMASECACLGTPAIYVNSLEVGYCTEQGGKYKLVYNYRNSEGVIEKAIELLNTPNLKEEFQNRRQKMLSDKIDVTAFLVWFIENYPQSVKIMKENPDYQYNFK